MDIVIAEAVRSAVGRGHKGSLATKRPDELAADTIRGLLGRVPQVAGRIDDVILGCAMPEGEQGLNVARLISLLGPEVQPEEIVGVVDDLERGGEGAAPALDARVGVRRLRSAGLLVSARDGMVPTRAQRRPTS